MSLRAFALHTTALSIIASGGVWGALAAMGDFQRVDVAMDSVNGQEVPGHEAAGIMHGLDETARTRTPDLPTMGAALHPVLVGAVYYLVENVRRQDEVRMWDELAQIESSGPESDPEPTSCSPCLMGTNRSWVKYRTTPWSSIYGRL